jgi:LuxR family quorum sensing-dependent transcriptional regulator
MPDGLSPARQLSTESVATEIKLSRREQEVLRLVAEGKDDGEIATQLSVSRTTAHAHVERAKRRMNAVTRAQAVAVAVNRGLI